jgi:hypothetical protein
MTIAFNCSACDAPLKLGDDLAGKKCKCPKCGAVTDVPGAGPAKKDTARVAAAAKTKPDTDEGGALDDPGESGGKKGKKAKAKKGGGMKWLLLGGGLLLLGGGLLTCACGGGVGAWWWFVWRTGPPDEVRYLPSGTVSVRWQRVDQLRNSAIYKEVAAVGKDTEFENFDKQFGIAAAEVDTRLVGGSRGAGAESVTVLRTKSSVQAAAIKDKLRGGGNTEFTETKVGKYTMYESKVGGQSFCVADSKVVVYGTAKTLRNVLERDKAPEFSSGMQAAMKKADFSKTETKVNDYSDGKGSTFGGFGGFGVGKSNLQLESHVEEHQAGSGISLRSVYTFKSASDASTAKKEWDDGYQKAKSDPLTKEFVADMQASASVSGNSLVIEGKMTAKALKNMMGNIK